MCEVNCLNCIVQEFKDDLCEEEFCEKFRCARGNKDFVQHVLEVAIPRGEWIPTDEMGYMVRCSKCNFITHDDVSEEYNFCPNCGTPMNEKALKIFRKRVGGK